MIEATNLCYRRAHMCGIAGIVRAEGPRPEDADAVARMTASLRHRGPDGHGLLTVGQATFGHRRLAIVDLSDDAAQPMTSEDGKTAITYNGEFYTFRELRRELEADRAFVSQSDTEVVLAGYERWGDAVLERLNGMYAFAIWDSGRRRLLLARDPYGQKPLYYSELAGGGVAFASEARALLLLDEVDQTLNRASIAKYLALDCFPAATTAFRGIKKLEPGCTLVLDLAAGEPTLELRRPPPRRYGVLDVGPEEAAAELWRLLVTSVERRLMSDVPLGLFLSGGLDSSAVLAAMAACVPASRIKTFAVGFREASFDESGPARQVAAAFGVEHSELILDESKLLALLPQVLDHLDQPLADVSVIPTYALSKFAREHVTVALGGDGGDELFAGYDTFVAECFARPYLRAPALARRAVAAVALALPPSDRRMSLSMRARRFVRGLDPSPVVRNLRWFGSFLPEEAAALVVGGPPAESIYEDLLARSYPGKGQSALELWTGWYLPDDVLTKVDRASMAVSLEVRAPLLDPELARFAHSLPYKYKVRGLTRKWIFKRALRGRLPDSIVARPKQGFGAPNGRWLRGPLREEVESLLDRRRLEDQGLLDPGLVQRVLREHQSGACDHRKQLWALYVLQRWLP
jgi:asparagine synthase (glutamine-hydrolysing)